MPSNYDIEMFKGDDLSLFLVYQIDGNNFDFSGYSADMDIRRSTHSENKVAEIKGRMGSRMGALPMAGGMNARPR